MFEGNLVPPTRDAAVGGDTLRALEWPVLVAQLAAARDLRATLGQANYARGGSFARLASMSTRGINECAGSVNQAGLARGKAGDGNVAEATDRATSADRETR